MDKKLLEKPENYYNREMSCLQFNYRILNEAKDKSIPLFERLNFLSITESNLSEFFISDRSGTRRCKEEGHCRIDAAGAARSDYS